MEEAAAREKAAETESEVLAVSGVSEDGDVTESLCPQGDAAAEKNV